MTDDIVTRLLDFTPLKDVDLARLMLDASSEIERLRKDRDRWKLAAEELLTQCGCDSHCPRFLKHPNGECECGFNKPFQAYQKAVRGEQGDE